MAARFRIIILDNPDFEAETQRTWRYVFWADIPTARQKFMTQPAGTKSAWIDAVQADNDQLVSGAVLEWVNTITVPAGATVPQMQQFLQDRWAIFNTLVQTNRWGRYGSTWNASGVWTMGGVA